MEADSQLIITATVSVTAPSAVTMSAAAQIPIGQATTAATLPTSKSQARSRKMGAMDPSSLIPARRSSTRSIKRKKFDDELVESSLVKTERGRMKASLVVSTATTPAMSVGHIIQSHGQNPTILPGAPFFGSLTAGVVTDGGKGILTHIAPVPLASSATITPVFIPQTVAFKAGKDEPKEAVKQIDVGILARPLAEKRSKPITGKTAATASKGAGTKIISSKSVSGRGGSGKGAGSKSGVTKSSHSKSRSKCKRSRKQKSSSPAIKDLGRWKPQDDLLLITAVQQTNDLSDVHTGVKFSCRFSLKELEERWYALLYDPVISKIAMEAARQLHSDTVATIQGKALYSNAEEKLLGTFASTSQPTLESFQNLLQQHPDIFHPARTAKTLHCHWLLMKQYHLLPDQTVQPMPRGDHILNLSDIEDFMNDEDIREGTDETIEQEVILVDRRNKREIRHLEQEMPKWQVLVDSVTGISMPDFDSQTLAVLRGRLVRYLMRSREISLGRATKDNHVDVDLSLEGPAWKISRRQGVIKLRNSGDFFVANEGKRPILVDGRPVMAGNKQKLNNNSVVEIACLRFTFLINQDIINAIRTDPSKPLTAMTAGPS